ncbi:hypothetical protein WH47_04547, partial [Habropoda laboriosa]
NAKESRAAEYNNVYGKDVLSVRKCQRWFSKFRNGVLDLSDKPVFKFKISRIF